MDSGKDELEAESYDETAIKEEHEEYEDDH
jgi:hypothetical protein